MDLSHYMDEDNVIGDWNKEKILGTGGFGTVVLWRNVKTKETIALKQCRWGHDSMMTPKHRQRWRLEIDIMRRLNHENVVKTVEVPSVLDVPSTEIPLMAMEYCCGGDLRKVLSKAENCCGMPEKQVRIILRHVTSAVEYLHSMRIIHRDLKPENIVVQEVDGRYVYKLIDLGYAKELDQGSLCTSFVGTLQYLAPELFLSHTYSSTVDFWSLGLLAHEVITGQRPFFPNLSPAQWIPLVKQKMPEEICAYLNENNKAMFSTEICSYCSISSSLKRGIEEWLQLLLEFEPKLRGRKNGVLAVFQVLQSLLQKKILRIFCVETCSVMEYEISEDHSVDCLQKWLEQKTGISTENQELLLPRGQPVDINVDVLQFWSNPEEDESMVFLFHCNPPVVFPDVSPRIPTLVERIMRNPRQVVNYETQRASWTESVFLSQQQTSFHQKLLQAYKVSLMHLLMKNSSVHKKVVKMQKQLTQLTARCEFFKTVLKQDIHECTEQVERKGHMPLETMCVLWKATLKKLEQLLTLQEQVADFEDKCSNCNTKTIDLQRSPYARSKCSDSMEETYQAILAAFSELKRKPKDQRSIKCDNTAMVKLLCICLKTREKAFSEVFSLLRKGNEIKKEMSRLQPKLEEVLEEIERFDTQLTVWQNERQESIWKLLSGLVQKVNLLESTLNAKSFESSAESSLQSLQHSSVISMSSSNRKKEDELKRFNPMDGSFHYVRPTDESASLQSLSLIVHQYTLESKRVRKENLALMNDMMSIMSQQQQEILEKEDMIFPILSPPN